MDKLTPQQFAKAMREIKDKIGGDPEIAHSHADILLCDQLEALGFSEGVKVFDEIKKRYD